MRTGTEAKEEESELVQEDRIAQLQTLWQYPCRPQTHRYEAQWNKTRNNTRRDNLSVFIAILWVPTDDLPVCTHRALTVRVQVTLERLENR